MANKMCNFHLKLFSVKSFHNSVPTCLSTWFDVGNYLCASFGKCVLGVQGGL